MTKRQSQVRLTAAQQRIIVELRELGSTHSELTVLDVRPTDEGALAATIELDISTLPKADSKFKLLPKERVVITFPSSFPLRPPTVDVEHDRWLNRPHVLYGIRLCIYLDVAKEWNPLDGVQGALNRLWEWFESAAADEFDDDVLYHQVGGVLHRAPDALTVVVGDVNLEPSVKHIGLTARTDVRIDVTSWGRLARDGEFAGCAVILNHMLPRGSGSTLNQFLERLSGGFPTSTDVADRVGELFAREVVGSHVYLLVAACNPKAAREKRYHLLVGRIDVAAARAAVSSAAPNADVPIEWMNVDDRRPEVNIRRDQSRPVEWFRDRTVEMWGCGALGSWVAELVVRAGARRLILRDPAIVTGGLLVRQNYTETDVGRTKAEALAQRLRGISDHTVIDTPVGPAEIAIIPEDGGPLALPDVDVIIDTTVSLSTLTHLDALLSQASDGCPVVQIATDTGSATLGIVHIAHPGAGVTLSDIDTRMKLQVEAQPELEPYGVMWDTAAADQIVPTAGCSVPTFRGSGADAAGIASTAVSLIGPALTSGESGGYLFRLPHSPRLQAPLLWSPALEDDTPTPHVSADR